MPPTYSSLSVLRDRASNLTFTPKCAQLHTLAWNSANWLLFNHYVSSTASREMKAEKLQ